MTLLLRLCDSVAPLVLILCKRLRKDLSGYILVIHNIFVFLNSSLIRGVMIKTHKISILRAFYFSLTEGSVKALVMVMEREGERGRLKREMRER